MYLCLNNYIIFGVILITIFLYLHITRRFNYWKNRNIPCIKPIPLFGNVFSICLHKKSIMSFLTTLYKSTTSPLFGFFIFDQPFLLLRDPKVIKKVLVSDFEHFGDRSAVENKRDKYSSLVLLTLRQPKAKAVRSSVSSLFSSAKLKSMVPLVLEASDSMVNYINDGCLNEDSTNCRDITLKYTLDVILSVLFGLKGNSLNNSKHAKACKKLMGPTIARLINITAYFFAPILVKTFNLKLFDEESAKYLEQIFLNAISERKETKINRPDLIDLMIQAQEKDPVLFDTNQIVALSFQYLVAGFETTGSVVAFALYELCLNTAIQDRVRNEILSVIGKHGSITSEAIQMMKYLDMVIKETLRKYPVVPFLDRRCTKTYKILETNTVIEKGIPVYIPIMELHYDEKYFPNPTKFDPERFSIENKLSITPFTYLPFGEGHHNCLGLKFGVLTVCIGLIKILTNFEVSISKDTPTHLTFENIGLLNVPKNNAIFIKFKKVR